MTAAISIMRMARNSLLTIPFLAASVFLFPVVPIGAQVLVGGPTTAWSPIVYSSVTPDFPLDEQATSLDADLVGDADNPSLYKAFWDGGTALDKTDGQIAFRLRMAGDQNPAGFKGTAYVGIDVSGEGSIDLFVGVVNAGGVAEVGIWAAGEGLNTAPNNTTIESTPEYSASFTGSNYNWSPVDSMIDPGVTNTNIDGSSGGGGNHTDHFLSFVVPFAELVEASLPFVSGGIDEYSILTFIAVTATQANSLNGDLNGVSRNYDGSSSWTELGILSDTYSAQSPVVIPEPGVLVLLIAGGCGIGVLRRRR